MESTPFETDQSSDNRSLSDSARGTLANRKQGAHLYFIKMEGSRPVKIGRANNPVERLKNLQVASPYRLRLLGTLDHCGEYEFQFHSYLGRHRLMGEWFRWSRLVEQSVKMALSGEDWKEMIAERPRSPSDADWEWFQDSPLYRPAA